MFLRNLNSLNMRALLKFLAPYSCSCLLLAFAGSAAQGKETLVFFRHAEKPAREIGQIDCKGLNRALALSKALAHFGTPDAIFAPNPSVKISDRQGGHYYYFRPLATVLPLAIQLGQTVDITYGFTEIDKLKTALLDPKYKNSLLFVAWEHKKLDQLVRNIIKDGGGDPVVVPSWPGDDYDTVFVVEIDSMGDASFREQKEGITGLSDSCPQ